VASPLDAVDATRHFTDEAVSITLPSADRDVAA
jgi:hypothetical protein